MDIAIDQPNQPLPSLFERFPKPATQAKHPTARRKLGLLTGLGLVAAGAGVAYALGARKRAFIAGGAAALALGTFRLQLARWFYNTPAYEVQRQFGEIEVRRYAMRVEARTELAEHDLEAAMDRGYGRLACYIYGTNDRHEDLAMSTPVVTSMRDGIFSVSFVMPPDRPLDSLPHPDDSRVTLREVSERHVAVLPFRGPWSRRNIEKHERLLLKRLVDAGLAARGSVSFAAYDSPMTVPALRRNEVWIELA